MRRRIALAAPALGYAGGVTGVADFVRRTIRTRPDLDLKLISLSMDSADSCSVLIRNPASWLRGVRMRTGEFKGEPVFHVGAWLGEIETQRLRQRRLLTNLVADCDLVQVVAGAPCWALPLVGLGKPVALQVATLVRVERRRRERLERGPLANWRRLMTRFTDGLDQQALRRVDAVQVENSWMLDHARRAAEGRDIIVRYAPPGVDITRFAPSAERAPESAYLLTVGRLDDPRKNIGLLLEAYALLCARMDHPPDLILAGSSGPSAGFWSRAETLGLNRRIHFHEKPSDAALSLLYRDAQTFVLPSDEEGFGVVVIEAMASGLPVVATRSGGPDDILTDGSDGFLVDLDDVQTLADRLHRLAIDPGLNRAMGYRARAMAETRYAEQIAGRAYLQLYDELLARKPPRTA